MTDDIPVSRKADAQARTARTKLTSTGVRKASAKSTRSRAREFALQALYQHLVGRN
ncbi:MAG: N utilization substance protein B, partial [Gammaproteobacteria bacterium]|nr:N utilization substance protein B [Gammaproteobacteria bacterium]